jgi:peptidoglycan/LPS O-acetylase OafA/YrhL
VFPVLYGLLLLGITVGIAHLSYKHFEKPFLAFSHRARTAGALPAEIKIA